MFDDFDFGGGGDALGDFIQTNDATGWDGNWTAGEDFLGGLADAGVSALGSSGGAFSGDAEMGALGMTGGSPNVNSVSEADMGVKAGIGSSGGGSGSGGGFGDSMTKVAKGMGLIGKDGKFDWTDPKTLDKIIKLGLGVGGLMQSFSANKQAQAQRQQQLQQQLQQQAKQQWSPQQAQWANNFFQNPTNPNRGVVRAGEGGIQSIMPSRGYAEGGQPMPMEGQMEEAPPMGAFGLLEGPGTGQSDSIPIDAARGEYIVDADTVAQIGDGSNAAGAEKLDAWIQNIRKHKRSAPEDEIPPLARNLDAYMPGE